MRPICNIKVRAYVSRIYSQRTSINVTHLRSYIRHKIWIRLCISNIFASTSCLCTAHYKILHLYSVHIYQKIRACSSHLYMLHNFCPQCAPIWQKYFCSTGTSIRHNISCEDCACICPKTFFSFAVFTYVYCIFSRLYTQSNFTAAMHGNTRHKICALLYMFKICSLCIAHEYTL